MSSLMLVGMLLVIVGVVSAAVIYANSFVHMPEWVVGVVVVVASLAAVIYLASLLFKRRTLKELRHKSTAELEELTFRYAADYFNFIGTDHAPSRRFREICDARDLEALKREWRRLESDFRSLELKAGHHGRPLIMDYYDDHDVAIRLLAERRSSGPTAGRLT